MAYIDGPNGTRVWQGNIGDSIANTNYSDVGANLEAISGGSVPASQQTNGLGLGDFYSSTNKDAFFYDDPNSGWWDTSTSKDWGMDGYGGAIVGAGQLGLGIASYIDAKKTNKLSRKLLRQQHGMNATSIENMANDKKAENRRIYGTADGSMPADAGLYKAPGLGLPTDSRGTNPRDIAPPRENTGRVASKKTPGLGL